MSRIEAKGQRYLPPEIVAERRAARRRTMRLYGIGIGGVALIIVAMFATYTYFAGRATYADTHTALASAAYAEGRLDSAARELRAAMTIRGDDHLLHFDLALILLKQGQYAAALPELQPAESHQFPPSYLYAAAAHLMLGRPDLARADAQTGLAIAVGDPPLASMLALTNERDAGTNLTLRHKLRLLIAQADLEPPQGDQGWFRKSPPNNAGG
jgi:tetratricopeptide (TPR) repeat protein